MGLLLFRYWHEFHPDLPVTAFHQLEIHDRRVFSLGRADHTRAVGRTGIGFLLPGREMGLFIYSLQKEDLPSGVGRNHGGALLSPCHGGFSPAFASCHRVFSHQDVAELAHFFQQFHQFFPLIRQGIFHLWRDLVKIHPADQAIPFE